ncbi:Heat shock protein [Venturia inaequalis]|nr:Heat shock protein [Venturia inaequalis]
MVLKDWNAQSFIEPVSETSQQSDRVVNKILRQRIVEHSVILHLGCLTMIRAMGKDALNTSHACLPKDLELKVIKCGTPMDSPEPQMPHVY